MEGEERFVGNAAAQAKLFLTLFRGWIGAAFVAMPFGFSSAGLLFAAIAVAVTGWLSAHCARLLLICKVWRNFFFFFLFLTFTLQYRRVGVDASFAAVAEDVLGPSARGLVDFLLVFCHAGFCVS